ncbi:MAG: sigma-70 family RNA polymerase sigma factor [Planctomycetota bacterium]
MEKLRITSMRALADQLLRGPIRLRLRQLLGIDFLLSVVEADKAYPFDFVCHALTGYRRPNAADGNGRLLDGDLLISDLVALAEELSADALLRAEDWPEELFSVPDLAGRFDVSTKTIFRWRRRGMAGWRFQERDNRTRLLFPERCVRRFVGRNAGLVSRGSSFSQLSKEERERIVARATELVKQGERTVNAVAKTIAAETGRAVETIRLILKHYDEAHPRAGVFNRSPLEVEADDQRLAVWEAYVDGVTVDALAKRFGKPMNWVYATITQMRARELRARKIEFVGSHEFEAPDADEVILNPALSGPLRQAIAPGACRIPSALPPYLANLFRVPLLTREGEQTLFRKMNYLKYKACKIVEELDPETVKPAELDRVDELLDQAAAVKNEIVQANLRLVVSIAKKHISASQDLFEVISDGNMSLMRAVDKFDYTRGFKFSTYASWALMKNYARSIPEERRHGERYQTGWDEMLDTVRTPEVLESDDTDHLTLVRGTIDRMLASLDVRERAILRQRYGLDEHGQPQTLEEIGRRFGVSKERIRQLEARAMVKLRGGFEEDVARLLGA